MSGRSPGSSDGDGAKSLFDKRMAVLGLVVAVAGSIVLPLYFHHDAQREHQAASGAQEIRSAGRCVALTIAESGAEPQPGQAQRSSYDFSLDNFPSGMRVLRWKVIGQNAGSVSFDILQDVPAGFDQVVYPEVRDGAETPHNNLDPLYIANPRNAQGQTFKVQVSACP